MKSIIVSFILFGASLTLASPLNVEKIESIKLEKPMKFFWEKEQPIVSEVTLVVAKVGSELLRPSQGYETVFFLNDRVAEKVKTLPGGRVVFIAPQKFKGTPELWVGPQMLPEEIDRQKAKELFNSYVARNFTAMSNRSIKAPKRIFSASHSGKVTGDLLLSEEQLYEKAKRIK